MSYGNNNGWGCGCGNTVQYAPSACNPNFPTACTALGNGVIQRVVGEDSAYCKYTVPTLAYNNVPASGILSFNATTGLVNWSDASSSNPTYLSSTPVSQTSGNLLGISTAFGNAGQLVEIYPASTTETTFPIIPSGGNTVNWGTVENLIPNKGVVCKSASTPPSGISENTVYELSGNATQVLSWDIYGNPSAVTATTFLGAVVPSGAVIPFAYNVNSQTLPDGWLLCDGSTYTITAYPALGALLGNTYGSGTGTFNVPDLRGYFIRGYGTNSDGTSSGTFGAKQTSSFASHTHAATVNDPQHTHSYTVQSSLTGAGSTGAYGAIGSTSTQTSSSPTNITVTNSPSGGSETRPVNIAMVYCIKT